MFSVPYRQLLRQPAAPLGVDIDETCIRIAQLTAPGQHALARVSAQWMLPLSPLRPDGAVHHAGLPAVIAALRGLIKSARIPTGKCVVTLPASGALTEMAQLPPIADHELEETVTWEAVDRFGLDRSDVVSGHLPLNADRPGPSRDLLLVAVRRATTIAIADMLVRCGLEPMRMELAPLAVMRLCMRDGVERQALLHIERSRACIMVMQDGNVRYQRSFGWHPAHISAIEALAGLGLGDTDDGAIPLVGDDAMAHTPQAMRWREVAEEVLASLRHAERRAAGCWPERIWVSGSGAAEPGLCEAVAAVCGTETGPIGTCPRITWPEGDAPESRALWAGAVAAGVAAREASQATARKTSRESARDSGREDASAAPATAKTRRVA
jgi:hypothetical protein